jgi:hypothetical protein
MYFSLLNSSSLRHSKVLLSASLFATTLGSATAFSGEKGHKAHKGHGAHEHGKAKLSLVVEGTKVTAQFESPSEGIYGFEHEAKSDADKKKRDAGLEKLKTQFDKMVIFESSLGCKFENTKMNVVSDAEESKASATEHKSIESNESKESGTHSETRAEFVANCTKAPAGSKVTFAFRKQFKGIRSVDVQLLAGEKQTGLVVKNDKGELSL